MKSQSTTKKVRAMLTTALILLLLGLLLLIGAFWAISPGKPKPYLDQNGQPLAGSLSEKVFVDIGGVRQGMFIKSKDARQPVLLYLHGGMPDYFLTRKYPTGLEDLFTVVWWEQRGSGISYSPDIPPETMTLEQMIKDVVEAANYLRRRFGQEKIYLMGHSGGTFIGIQAAAQAPDLFHAYIGIAQMSNQLQSERLAYAYMLERFRQEGNMKMVRKLEAAPVVDGTPPAYLIVRDQAMHQLGIGTTRDMNSVVTGVFLPSLTCPDYTLKEKINMWRGKAQSGVSSMWSEMLATNLSDQLSAMDIPIYFFAGVHDYTVSSVLARAFFEQVEAPVKGFYLFEESAHSPLFEEPEKTRQILREDVLKGGNGLADVR
jgi:pimeloyl-ACP methyl ester carboxylesterase